jgi:membrane-bound lytic murein transglycosylase
MKSITIALDERTLAGARREAAQRNVSLSRYIGDLLRAHLRASRQYDDAMRRCLARAPVRLREDDKPYPTREESHRRGGRYG